MAKATERKTTRKYTETHLFSRQEAAAPGLICHRCINVKQKTFQSIKSVGSKAYSISHRLANTVLNIIEMKMNGKTGTPGTLLPPRPFLNSFMFPS